jgi:hypothetical protein
MKKVLAIVAMATLAACGGASTEVSTTDSTTAVVDSTSVDTVAAPAVDTTVTK